MKCIILAAGYATRLYPLTKNQPKPLLKVGEKPILEHILEKVTKIRIIDEIFIVTNGKFYPSFLKWAEGFQCNKAIKIINDQTTTNDNRLGAIADLQFVIEKEELDEDIIVLAGDNLFEFELVDFVEYYQNIKADCITTHELDHIEELKSSGVIEVDASGKVISFEEKPQHPRSNLAVPPFYIYQKETVPLIKQYIKEGNNPDAPGYFIPWLIAQKDVYAYKFKGLRYDIGTLESYKLVQGLF